MRDQGAPGIQVPYPRLTVTLPYSSSGDSNDANGPQSVRCRARRSHEKARPGEEEEGMTGENYRTLGLPYSLTIISMESEHTHYILECRI